MSLELLVICLSAFISVFVLLAVLALVMRLIIVAFPEKIADTDAALIAAVTLAAQGIFPGMKTTKVEEIK